MQQQGAMRRTIRLEGTFDAEAMQHVTETLRRTSPGERVTLDLSRVREMDDHSVARLAEWAAGPLHVEIRGLRQHQLRLLQYFGLASAAL